jgi:hypothetical protein
MHQPARRWKQKDGRHTLAGCMNSGVPCRLR